MRPLGRQKKCRGRAAVDLFGHIELPGNRIACRSMLASATLIRSPKAVSRAGHAQFGDRMPVG